VAAPVLLGAGAIPGRRLVAVVALAAPTVRLPAAHTERVARRVVAAAERIRANLEGRAAA
jgi:DNA-binding IclR family transcriptional regulator